MFNFKNSNSGKIMAKLLATLLVLTLTFANFALVGSYIGESIAASEDVIFDVYFTNGNGERVEEADINSQEINLYVSVSVQNSDYLNNAVLEFTSTNFKIKNNPELTSVKLGSIQSENGVSVEIPIVAKNDELYNLTLLDMQSQIKLTGEHVNEAGNVIDIDITKPVKIKWTSDSITTDDIELSQQLITNKIYNIDGTDKRVVQLLVRSKIQNNKAPVESSIIEITNPQIGGTTIVPVDVKVASYGTEATNGKNSEWSSTSAEGKTTITILNTAVENVVSWKKDCEDIFVVTYVYDKDVEISTFVSNVKNIIDIYGRTEEGTVEKTNQLSLTTDEEISKITNIGNIVNLETSITENIYKGNLYVNGETTYEVKDSIYIPYSNIIKTIGLVQNGSKLEDSEGNEITEGVTTYYKTTKINVAQAKEILGTTGKIEIYDLDTLDTDNPTKLAEISLAEETEEEYYTVSYDREITGITIITQAQAEGILDITSEKVIKASKPDTISNISKLTNYSSMSALNIEATIDSEPNDNEVVSVQEKESIANLIEPSTTFDISLDKNSLSTQTENELKITTILKTDEDRNKLYSNPTINIELPKEITEASLEGKLAAVLYDNGLTLNETESKVITNSNGNRELIIKLDGTQSSYNSSAQNATITATLKVKTDSFIPDKNVEIKVTCINGADNVESKENIKLVSKKGLITKNTLTVGENTIQKVNNNNLKIDITENANATISTEIINNFGENISNINIIGNVPEGITLTNGIASNTQGLAASYSEIANDTIDSTNWKTEVTDYSKIKSIKLSLDEIANGSIVDLSYGLNINADSIEEATELVNSLNLKFVINEQIKQDTIEYILNVVKNNTQPETPETPEDDEGSITNTEKLSIEVLSTAGGDKVENGAEINNGQLLRYKVKVTNTSLETINNLNLKVTKQNGVFYDLVQCGVIMDESKDAEGNFIYPEGKPTYAYNEVEEMEFKDFKINELKSGETTIFEYQIVAYMEEGQNKFNNNILITADNIENINLVDTKTIKEAKIALKLKYGYNEDVLAYTDSEIDFSFEIVNLTNSKLENITVKMDLPEELKYYEGYQISISNDENVTLTDNGKQIILTFKKLEANEKQIKTIRFKSNDFEYSQLSKNIILKAIANVDGDNENYISNDLERTIYQTKTDIKAELKSDKEGKTLGKGEEIVYALAIKNNGYIDATNIRIDDYVQPELMLINAKIIYSNGEEKNISINENNSISVIEDIGVQETLNIIIKAKVISDQTEQISNKISINVAGNGIITTETLTNNVIGEINDMDNNGDDNNSEQPGDNETPEQPGGNEKPNDPNKDRKYSISGLAWVDENKDGIRQTGEKTLQLIKVILLDSKGNKVAETTTSLTGTYKFSNLDKGEYMVAFEYDTGKYAVAKYKVSSANEENNSDAISKTITLNNENRTVGITDTIKLTNKDITNIDIGLIENPMLDLSLNKYISKVVVTNKQETKTYEYNDTELAKVEIGAKYIAGTSLLVEYEIEIVNDGDVNGYVTDIIDYLPKELEFNSEMNSEWYLGKDNNLHYMALNPEPIEPGKTQTVKLVLTKTLKSDSTGTIENVAEIAESTSLEALKDIDSIAGNKQSGEDDIGKASLIISIKTGSPMMYIGIVIASMAVLGVGIYIIDKKVLKVRI